MASSPLLRTHWLSEVMLFLCKCICGWFKLEYCAASSPCLNHVPWIQQLMDILGPRFMLAITYMWCLAASALGTSRGHVRPHPSSRQGYGCTFKHFPSLTTISPARQRVWTSSHRLCASVKVCERYHSPEQCVFRKRGLSINFALSLHVREIQ